jgi:hypothetical protein
MTRVKHPDLTREELIIILDVYFGGVSRERVVELSEYLRSLPIHGDRARDESFRNVEGMKRRLNEFESLARGEGGRVRARYREVWNEYRDDREKLQDDAYVIRLRMESRE